MKAGTTPTTATAGVTGSQLGAPVRAGATGPRNRSTFGRFVSDTLTMTRRNVLYLVRRPQVIVFALISPIMFVSLFNFVFGGSLDVPGLSYANYLIPGIMVQTVMFGGSNTAVGLAEDMTRGVIDRFRSLPMSRLAVLSGRTMADAMRGIITNSVIIVMGFVIGFRFNNGFGWAVASFLLVLLFGYSITWFYAWMGLSLGNVEAVQAASFLPAFPLTFAASTFAPVENMPGWLQVFSAHQPVTQVVDATRAMMQGGEIAGPLVRSLLWCAGIMLVFGFLSVRQYRKG
ncbi:MAG: ABC transporter permease [Acidimicrobiia bacterium]|nr:ABC transporter permease [Acidimicrobiia bacterium]MDH5519247.1 ABC transporter permease [Acidimicrobiia bacterium]